MLATLLRRREPAIDLARIGGECFSLRGAAVVMHGALPQRIEDARAIDRQLRRGSDKIVGRKKFGAVAKVLWPPPLNVAAELATIAGVSTRTAERWLSGEFEPPYCIVEATMHEIFGGEA